MSKEYASPMHRVNACGKQKVLVCFDMSNEAGTIYSGGMGPEDGEGAGAIADTGAAEGDSQERGAGAMGIETGN